MQCHFCSSPFDWDGISPIVTCGLCGRYRFTDVPDSSADSIVSLQRPGTCSCPCCRQPLTLAGVDGLKAEQCADCDGVLMSSETFAMFVRNRRTEFRESASQPLTSASRQRPKGSHCPNCRRTMKLHPRFGPNRIVIEECFGCGMIWLDCNRAVAVVQSEG